VFPPRGRRGSKIAAAALNQDRPRPNNRMADGGVHMPAAGSTTKKNPNKAQVPGISDPSGGVRLPDRCKRGRSGPMNFEKHIGPE